MQTLETWYRKQFVSLLKWFNATETDATPILPYPLHDPFFRHEACHLLADPDFKGLGFMIPEEELAVTWDMTLNRSYTLYAQRITLNPFSGAADVNYPIDRIISKNIYRTVHGTSYDLPQDNQQTVISKTASKARRFDYALHAATGWYWAQMSNGALSKLPLALLNHLHKQAEDDSRVPILSQRTSIPETHKDVGYALYNMLSSPRLRLMKGPKFNSKDFQLIRDACLSVCEEFMNAQHAVAAEANEVLARYQQAIELLHQQDTPLTQHHIQSALTYCQTADQRRQQGLTETPPQPWPELFDLTQIPECRADIPPYSESMVQKKVSFYQDMRQLYIDIAGNQRFA